ncbi:MAG: HAD-IB family phosphatase [Desulfurococcaceae archaeon]
MKRKLIVFDCDGVLIEDKSSWEILLKYFGCNDNKYFMELYRKGLISYLDWMKIDIALMIHSHGKPITKKDVEIALSNIRIRDNIDVVTKKLRDKNYLIAVISSGIDIVVRKVCEIINADICLYNELIFRDDELIPGGIPRVPLMEKPRVIMDLANSLGIDLKDVVYVGDSEWDIEVFKIVGTSIAIEPCSRACKYATYVVKDLREIASLV